MNKMARVLAVDNMTATVSFEKHVSCGDCCACGGGEEKGKSKIEVFNEVGAKVGDFVEIELNDANVLGAAFKLYIIPLIVMVLTIGAIQILLKNQLPAQNAEIISAIGGFVAVVLVYIFIRLKYNNADQKRRYMAAITKVFEELPVCNSSKRK